MSQTVLCRRCTAKRKKVGLVSFRMRCDATLTLACALPGECSPDIEILTGWGVRPIKKSCRGASASSAGIRALEAPKVDPRRQCWPMRLHPFIVTSKVKPPKLPGGDFSRNFGCDTFNLTTLLPHTVDLTDLGPVFATEAQHEEEGDAIVQS